MENGNRYRLLIADDQTLFRRGLRTILAGQPDLEVADEACTLEEAVEKATRQMVDLIVVSDNLMRESVPPGHIHTLLLTTAQPDGVQADGIDTVPRSASPAQLVNAVRCRARVTRTGERIASQADLRALAASTRGYGVFPGLTARETEIVRLIAEGLTARELAKELRLSIKTVEAHKLNIMRKLGVHNRASLVRFAAEHDALSLSA